jgi:hypothetical protein
MQKLTRPFLRWALFALCAGLVTAARAATPKEAAQDPVPQQTPPIKQQLTRISFVANAGDLLRLVVTNDSAPVGSVYANWTEYWSGSRETFIDGVSSLVLKSSSAQQLTEQDIKDYLLPSSAWGATLAWKQVIGTAGWTKGTYVPKAARKRLFAAVDPDDASRKIGLLIEQNSDGTLARMTWYKAALTGTIFAAVPSQLSFTQVLNVDKVPSTNPGDIDPTATWYYATGP